MTQYAVLIYEPGDPDWSVLDTEQKRQTMAEYGAFGQTVAAVLRGVRRCIRRRLRRRCARSAARS